MSIYQLPKLPVEEFVIEVQPLTFILQVIVLPAFTENVTFQIDSGLCFGPTFITTKYAVVMDVLTTLYSSSAFTSNVY